MNNMNKSNKSLGILTCTSYDKHNIIRDNFCKITNLTKIKFASQWLNVQYIYSDSIKEELNLNVLPYWLKCNFILKYIDLFDYILWMDDDAGIVDQSFDINSFLNSLDESKSIFIANDENGINAGVFFMKNSEISKECLKYIISKQSLKEYNKLYYDQTVLIDFINNHKEIYQEISGSIFNAHHKGFEHNHPNKYCDSTFIVHVAGGDYRKKILGSNPESLKKIFKIEKCF